MRTIKKEIVHITTDNHKFHDREDAKEWQSVLDMRELTIKNCGDGKLNIKDGYVPMPINNRNELYVVLDYLYYYIGFEGIYKDYSDLKYPTVIEYDINHKKMKIK